MAVTLLETVAGHELRLREEIAAAHSESRRIVDAAYVEGATLQAEDQARLEAEIAERRRQSAAQRAELVARIECEADERVRAIRAGATPKLDEVRREVIARILPARAGVGS